MRSKWQAHAGLRGGGLGLRLTLVFLLFFPVLLHLGQPKNELTAPPPLEPVEGERQARILVMRLLEQKPEVAVTNNGLLKIRDSDGKTREISARFDIVPRANDWLAVYEAAGAGGSQPINLTIIHSEAQPNQYFLSGPGASANKKLSLPELMTPFAGSDFWVADLGLEFLHWPQQRILRKQMRKGLSCDVLQSISPQPSGGYSRVVSWIAINRPEDIVIVHAEAFDSHDKLLKEFDPKKVEKVNGVWQLEEMEIRNRQMGTRTRIDFNVGE